MDAAALKAWREDRNLSVREMGGLLGVSHATISRWETGSRGLPGWLSRFMECLERGEQPHPPAAAPGPEA